jgi:hypothetical protein
MDEEKIGVYFGERSCYCAMTSDFVGIQNASCPTAVWMSQDLIAVGAAAYALTISDIAISSGRNGQPLHTYINRLEGGDLFTDATAMAALLLRLGERLGQFTALAPLVFAVDRDKSDEYRMRIALAAELANVSAVGALDSLQAIGCSLDPGLWRRERSIVLLNVMAKQSQIARLERKGDRVEFGDRSGIKVGYSLIEDAICDQIRTQLGSIRDAPTSPQNLQLQEDVYRILEGGADQSRFTVLVNDFVLNFEPSPWPDWVSPLTTKLAKLQEEFTASKETKSQLFVVAAPRAVARWLKRALSASVNENLETIDSELSAAVGAARSPTLISCSAICLPTCSVAPSHSTPTRPAERSRGASQHHGVSAR